jgi:hypothetical protein
MHPQTILAVLFTSTFALAQSTLYVPDNMANVGTCNSIPMSPAFAAATTYVARIPASYLDPNQRVIRDVELAPCATTTFTAANLQMGMGHVPNPLPSPFTFPTFDAAGNVTALGSFLDYTPFWDTVSQGPFNWTMTQDTWSPMGIATPSFAGFVWNGTDDIGFYITYNTASGGGSCHRTATEPFRVYTSGTYQAPSSTGSGAAGLKMGLDTGWPAMCQGCGSLTLSLNGVPNIGGSITSTLGNLGGGIPVVGMGFSPFCFAQYCNLCTIGHGWQAATFGATQTLNIPNNSSYVGIQIGFQGIGLLSPGGCQSPAVSFSDTYVLTIMP